MQPDRAVPHSWTRAPGGHSQLAVPHQDLTPTLQLLQNMPFLGVLAICLFRVSEVLSIESSVYVLDTNPSSQTPEATLPSRSRMACSAKCSSLEDGSCDGFQYLANGTCHLYPKIQSPFCPISDKLTTVPSTETPGETTETPEEATETPEETTTETGLSEQPPIYRRRRSDTSSACPGLC